MSFVSRSITNNNYDYSFINQNPNITLVQDEIHKDQQNRNVFNNTTFKRYDVGSLSSFNKELGEDFRNWNDNRSISSSSEASWLERDSFKFK
jgi:hypothetical protein